MIANKFLGADSCKLWRITLPICFDVTFIPFLLFSFFSFLQLKRIQNISRSITEFLSTCILSQCKPNARNMIYKCLQESVKASHQYVIVRNVWAFSASLNFRYISNCKSFSYLGTVTGSRPQFCVNIHGSVLWDQRKVSPNARHEIYKSLWDHIAVPHRHMIIWIV